MKTAARWLTLSIAILTSALPARAADERPTLSSLPRGTRLLIDAPPSRFEAEFRGVDSTARALVVAVDSLQPGESTLAERRLPLPEIRGIEYQPGTDQGQRALRGLHIGLLVGGLVGGMVGRAEPNPGERSDLIVGIAYGGVIGGLSGLVIGFVTGAAPWAPVDLSPPPQPGPVVARPSDGPQAESVGS